MKIDGERIEMLMKQHLNSLSILAEMQRTFKDVRGGVVDVLVNRINRRIVETDIVFYKMNKNKNDPPHR